MYINDYDLLNSNSYQLEVEDRDGNLYQIQIESDKTDAGIEYNVYGNHHFDNQDLVNEFIKILERQQGID